MSKIGVFVGPEGSKLSNSHEDPSSLLRLAALAASWAASQGQTLLVIGDAAALLTLGTAILGLQQGHVLEGGDRRASPMRVISLLESGNPGLDRSLSFWRRSSETSPGDQGRGSFDEGREPRDLFGDLSLLLDLGIMDVVGESHRSLEPKSPGAIAGSLGGQLLAEGPQGILAFGQLPDSIALVTHTYAREMRVPFSCVLGEIEGAERLTSEPTAPVLSGRTLRFQGQGPFRRDRDDEEVQETADEELVEVARRGTWEAGMTFRLHEWLLSLDV